MVSLSPRDTFKGRGNGMREDLTQLNPRFLRLPGGCVVNAGTYAPCSQNQDRRRICRSDAR